jgi:hypothetical protein
MIAHVFDLIDCLSVEQHNLLASGGGTADRHIRFWYFILHRTNEAMKISFAFDDFNALNAVWCSNQEYPNWRCNFEC